MSLPSLVVNAVGKYVANLVSGPLGAAAVGAAVTEAMAVVEINHLQNRIELETATVTDYAAAMVAVQSAVVAGGVLGNVILIGSKLKGSG
jgi:hypothetical protein